MTKIRFSWSQQYGQYTLIFLANGKSYEYQTYDGYMAQRIIDKAWKRPGTAWNMAKGLFDVKTA